MRVFFNAIIVHTLFNIYVFWWGYKFIPIKRVRLLISITFIVEFLIYMFGFVLSTDLPDQILHNIAIIGTSWMVFILYMTGFLIIYDSMFLLSKKVFFFRNLLNIKWFRRPFYYTFAGTAVILLMIWGSIRFWNPVVNEVDISITKTGKNIKTLRVAMVSDLHLGYLINNDVLKVYVDKILEQKPDIVLMPGDIIDHHLSPLKEHEMHKELLRLQSVPYGIYASTGNHEYRENVDKNVEWLENKAKITVLRDSVAVIADSFVLIGREDDKDRERASLKAILEKYNIDNSIPTIVLNHEPHNLAEEADESIDIALYGHTHNGQLFPANLLIDIIYEVGHGYKKKDNTHVYVSSGLGLSGPQYRIGTISEIVMLNINFE